MKRINNVLICGVGAIGSIYASKIIDNKNFNLRVLVDKDRLEKYTKSPKIFNGKELKLDYVLPEDNSYKADLIIIATKFDGLKPAVSNIKNYVGKDTIILSLLNGVTSEEIIAEKYGWRHTLLSYFIGHSAMRDGNKINFDGVGKTVFGVKNSELTDIHDVEVLKTFFDEINLEYETPDDMLRALWLKYLLNVSSNQLSAILKMTFGQMQNNKKYIKLMKDVMAEVVEIAKLEGVKNADSLIEEAVANFNTMCPEGKTSMLQDVEAKRKSELDMFATTVINYGKKHNIDTPYNIIIKQLIETIEEENSKKS